MNSTKFRKLSQDELYEVGGGFAFLAILGACLPLLINSVAQLLSSIKMYNSDSGSLKTSKEGFETKWESHEKEKTGSAEKNSKAKELTKTLVYAY